MAVNCSCLQKTVSILSGKQRLSDRWAIHLAVYWVEGSPPEYCACNWHLDNKMIRHCGDDGCNVSVHYLLLSFHMSITAARGEQTASR